MSERQRRILLIAPPNSYRLAPYLEAARRWSLDVLVVSEGEHAVVGSAFGGLNLALGDTRSALRRIVEIAEQSPLHAVVATDDATVELAAHVARALGLSYNDPGAARLTRRKDQARAQLKAAGLPVPDFRLIDLRRPLRFQVEGLGYPCVAKPLSLAGSRGVIRADSEAELRRACDRIGEIIASEADEMERTCILVERFVAGSEVALEGMLRDGSLEVLAIFDKPDPLDGPFFEETYYITPSRLPAETRARVTGCVLDACRAYGLRQGPVHAEVRIDGGDVWVIEVAARTIGGQCARLLRFGTGHGLEDLVIAQSVGIDLAKDRCGDAAGVLMIPIPRRGILRRVEGVTAAQGVAGVTDVEISIREGYELVPLPEGDSYLGFVFAEGATAAEVERALRDAHRCLRIVTAPLIPLVAAPLAD